MSNLTLSQGASCQLAKAPKRTNNRFELAGEFTVELIRGGEVIHKETFPNGITDEGKSDLLDVHFSAGTQLTSWYLGLIDNANFSALAATDTYDNIDQPGNGWDEFAGYTDPANSDSAVSRPGWTESGPSGSSITNNTQVSVDMTAAGTVKGLFVVAGTNAQTKSDHSATGNVLWSTALFSGGDVVVAISDELKVTYTVNVS